MYLWVATLPGNQKNLQFDNLGKKKNMENPGIWGKKKTWNFEEKF